MLRVDWLFKAFRSQARFYSLFSRMASPSVMMLLLAYMFVVLTSCAGAVNTPSSNSASQGPWPSSLAVTFTSSTSYDKALRLITDLGLQPAIDCVISSTMITPSSGTGIMPQRLWQPVGQKDTFLLKHQLLVDRVSPPSDWWKRLNATPGVRTAGFLDPAYGICKAVTYTTPSPHVAIPSSGDQSGTYIRIIFGHQEDYDTSLYTISNEGLRLIDPCYEQANLKGQRPAWHPMGQEHAFVTSHTLIVATSRGITSTLWREHLRTVPSILSLEYPFTQTCAN